MSDGQVRSRWKHSRKLASRTVIDSRALVMASGNEKELCGWALHTNIT